MKKALIPFKPKMIIDEISDATTEAIYPIARTISKSPFGSIFIKIREFGIYLTRADNFQNRLIGRFCEYYDGIVTGKQTKTDETERNIEGISVTALMYTDYAAFGSEISKNFKLLLQTGFARRCMISFNKPEKLKCKTFTKEEKQKYYTKLDIIGEKIFKIFTELKQNSCFEITDKAYSVFNDYNIFLNEKRNDEDDALVKKEIISRHLKSIKLSELYAILNHPTETVINEEDANQAIICVEFMSKDFNKFINYKPAKSDAFDNIYRWFKEHEGESFSKTELTKKYFKDFGYSRVSFFDNFDIIIDGVKKLAELNDYVFNIQEVKPYGKKYSLVKVEERPLSCGIKEFETIITPEIVEDDNVSIDPYSFNPF